MVTEALLCYQLVWRKKGERKKKLKKGALHLNDGLVHRPVSPVWQETLSSWSAVTLVCRGQVRECVNTLITEPGNGFFAPLCSRNMSSVCGRELLRLIECLINGFPSLLVPLNIYPTAFWKYIYTQQNKIVFLNDFGYDLYYAQYNW